MMADRYTLLKRILKALGLSQERIEQVLAWIETWREEDEEASGEGRPARERYPYQMRGPLLTAAELHFYRSLTPAAEGWAVVFAKVRLGDLFKAVTPDHRQWRIATNRVNQKHVDFVLCDPQTMAPLLGIELNDRSHEQADRRKRDRFVVRAFEAAGLPLVGVKVRASYRPEQLGEFLRRKAGLARERPVAQDTGGGEARAAVPACPECGKEMVLRTARRGPNAGGQFWGCSGYPGCREIVEYAG